MWLEEYMKKILGILTHRVVLVILMIIAQVALLAYVLMRYNQYAFWFLAANYFIGFVVFMLIVNSRRNPVYKLAWVVLVMLDPFLGTLLYVLFGRVNISKKRKKLKQLVYQKRNEAAAYKAVSCEDLAPLDTEVYKQAYYQQHAGHFPLYRNTDTWYFPLGEDMYQSMQEEMKKAKRYIFFEYFIIGEGEMWNTLLGIMEQKVKEGVDVRVMYDDLGSSFTLAKGARKMMESKGIKVGAFNPFVPVVSSHLNNRSHRKSTIIDGMVAYTGGINISDEYVNMIEVFGHWKDTAVMLKGDGAWGMATQFLAQWDYTCGEEKDYDFYRPDYEYKAECEGWCQPHGDDPLEPERVGANIYMNMITNAQKYVYIVTPYLIINNEMLEALCTAAKCGIDVRILTPGIRDKWFVHPVTRSFYQQLIESNVRVFEYTPGFVHAKSFVSDDKVGVVGTVNLDYRSLFLHLENGVWMYKTKAVDALKKDFLDTLELSKEITLEECKRVSLPAKIGRGLLRVFAPTM